MSRKKKPVANATAAGRLLTFVERIEWLLEEVASLRDDIKSVKAEAKVEGFDVPTIMRLIKLRALTSEQRAEQEALLDLYKAAIGMLDGTPLGRAARRRLEDDQPADDQPADERSTDKLDDGDDEARSLPEEPPQEDEAAGRLTEQDIETARQAGREAARAGAKVLSNPYVADDPRRAAWDEGWCAESGSDGMDLPAAWRRTPRKAEKKSDDDEGRA